MSFITTAKLMFIIINNKYDYYFVNLKSNLFVATTYWKSVKVPHSVRKDHPESFQKKKSNSRFKDVAFLEV